MGRGRALGTRGCQMDGGFGMADLLHCSLLSLFVALAHIPSCPPLLYSPLLSL
jgi:hypothetical protein